MRVISDEKVILRDFIKSDIERRVYWETIETEWQLWDAPWEYENLTEAEKKADLEMYIRNMEKWVKRYSQMAEDDKRTGFQIEIKDESSNYIGWCNSYHINEEYKFDDGGEFLAVGIDIPEKDARGNGYALAALKLLIKYVISKGETDIYTQTWSGNIRMINLAKKIGFEECNRNKDCRIVRGKLYDGLTFKLNIDKFNSLFI